MLDCLNYPPFQLSLLIFISRTIVFPVNIGEICIKYKSLNLIICRISVSFVFFFYYNNLCSVDLSVCLSIIYMYDLQCKFKTVADRVNYFNGTDYTFVALTLT